MFQFVIVIPIFKNFCDLTIGEKKSLHRSLEVFVNEDIVLLVSDSVSISGYKSGLTNKIIFKSISKTHFNNTDSYSKLLISSYFYSLFDHYKWMLICQLDAYVFNNDLHSYVDRNDFFFIGAPVVNANIKDWDNQTWVGNGGFSLRRVDEFVKVSQKLEYLKMKLNIYPSYLLMGNTFVSAIFRLTLEKIYKVKFNKYLLRYFSGYKVNEDIFWCLWVPSFFIKFKISDINTASRFSFEVSPTEMYNSILKMPMGCHAWEKYDPDYWAKYIL
jgi:hypothetical protein